MTRKEHGKMRLATVLGIAILLGASGSTSLAAERLDSDTPPGKYALSDVSIEVRESGNQESTSTRIEGAGRGTVTTTWKLRDDTTSTFQVEPARVFQLLQLCYREGFFGLQSSYGPPPTLRLGADGTVETGSTIIADAGGTSVTVRIGGYMKSVGYLKGSSNPPPVVTELERQVNELRTTGSRTDGHGGRSSNFAVNATVLASRRLQGNGRAKPARSLCGALASSLYHHFYGAGRDPTP
jgi:hypothetical protein